MKRVLIACEESQAICKAFRGRGFEAFSCDIQDPSGGHPEWHIKGDAVEVAYGEHWDLMIAHPPCTYLSRAGARWMYEGGIINEDRKKKAIKARAFFMKLLNAPIHFRAIENPMPLKVCKLPSYTQRVQPYEYGHPFSKKTLLWLRNLPLLRPTNILSKYTPFLPSNTGGKKKGQSYSMGTAKNQKEASKTFQGIADAMADQWGRLL